jgi:DNA-binding transcriptional regulator YdaS (Cro superfamily)
VIKSAIERAAFAVGGQTALARELGLRPQTVQKMCSKGRVKAEHVLPIERITKGAVTRHELRPDLYPLEETA